MIVEVGGGREAVAPYVGAVWILLIRPPVVAFGEVVMRPTLAPFAVRGGHRDRLLGKISICSAENSRPVNRRDKVIRRGCTAGPGSTDGNVASGSNSRCQKLPPRRHPHLVSFPFYSYKFRSGHNTDSERYLLFNCRVRELRD